VDDQLRPRIVVIDDHPVIAAGLTGLAPQIEVVYRYLKAAVDKLAGLDGGDSEASGKHPGARIDDVALRSGLSGGLVRWEDLQTRRNQPPAHVADRRDGHHSP
jgi:hypothetical protein